MSEFSKKNENSIDDDDDIDPRSLFLLALPKQREREGEEGGARRALSRSRCSSLFSLSLLSRARGRISDTQRRT